MRDSTGDTPLHISAAYNNLSAMQALYPASFEEDESSVEFVDDYQPQDENRGQHSSFYKSPREYHPNTQPQFDTWRHHNSFYNQLNDSGFFSTRSNGNAWTKSDVPHRIEEEKDSIERSSIDDSLTVTTTHIESDKWTDFIWLISTIFGVLFGHLKRFSSFVLSRRLKQTPVSNEARMTFIEPPSHIREAMEMYKLSRQKTFKAGSSSK